MNEFGDGRTRLINVIRKIMYQKFSRSDEQVKARMKFITACLPPDRIEYCLRGLVE